MHSNGTVVLSRPPSFKLDVADGFHNHWHVKSVFLKEIPATGVRVYNYFDDGVRNTVGGLDCTRYIVLSNPSGGQPLAIVDEHWSYAIRSAAAATSPMRRSSLPHRNRLVHRVLAIQQNGFCELTWWWAPVCTNLAMFSCVLGSTGVRGAFCFFRFVIASGVSIGLASIS